MVISVRTAQGPGWAMSQALATCRANLRAGTGAIVSAEAPTRASVSGGLSAQDWDDAETSAQPWALASGLPAALPATRLLRCAAGFHRDERAARELAKGLRQDLGLSAAQITLLRPGDAQPGRYRLLARRWAPPPAPAADAGAPWQAWAAGLVAVLGVGMPSLLLAASGLAPASAIDLPLASAGWAGALRMALLACALVFALVITLAFALTVMLAATPRPPGRRFDRALQRALRRGDWAVVVHDLPTALQADVATALRHNSRCWCAQAPRRAA